MNIRVHNDPPLRLTPIVFLLVKKGLLMQHALKSAPTRQLNIILHIGGLYDA